MKSLGLMFLSLACVVLSAMGSCMSALGRLSKRGIKGSGVAFRVVLAVLSTALAVGIWCALAFVVRPFGG